MVHYFKSRICHLIHCTALVGTIILLMPYGQSTPVTEGFMSSWEQYGLLPVTILYLARILTLLCLPLAVANFLGLTLFNAFPDHPKSKVLSKLRFI